MIQFIFLILTWSQGSSVQEATSPMAAAVCNNLILAFGSKHDGLPFPFILEKDHQSFSLINYMRKILALHSSQEYVLCNESAEVYKIQITEIFLQLPERQTSVNIHWRKGSRSEWGKANTQVTARRMFLLSIDRTPQISDRLHEVVIVCDRSYTGCDQLHEGVTLGRAHLVDTVSSSQSNLTAMGSQSPRILVSQWYNRLTPV